jgi:hypothetical protein
MIVENLDSVSVTCLAIVSQSYYAQFQDKILKNFSFTNVMVTFGSVRLLQWALESNFPISFIEVLKQSCIFGNEKIFNWAVKAIKLENNLMEDNIFLTSLCNIAARYNQIAILDKLRLRFHTFPSNDIVEDFPHHEVVKWYAEYAPDWDVSSETIIERAAEINAPGTLTLMKELHFHIAASAILYPAAKNGHIEIIEWAAKHEVVPPEFDYGYYFQRALSFLKLEAAKHLYSLGVSINKHTFVRAIMLPLVRNRTKSMDRVVNLLEYLVEEIGCEIDDKFHVFAARFPSPDIIRFGYKYNVNLDAECFQEAFRAYRRRSVKSNDYSSFFTRDSSNVFIDDSPLNMEPLSVVQFLVDSNCPVPEDFFLFCLKELIYMDAFSELSHSEHTDPEDDAEIEVFYHTQINQIIAYLVTSGVTVTTSAVNYAERIGWSGLMAELSNYKPTSSPRSIHI